MTPEVQQFFANQLRTQYSELVTFFHNEYQMLLASSEPIEYSEEDYIQTAIVHHLQRSQAAKNQSDYSIRNLAAAFRVRNNPLLCQRRVSTGFPELDQALGGGISAGLHVIGAVSSLGKSTYVLQIADHMLQSGHHVILVNLEMSPINLCAKLISMHTYLDTNKNTQLALTDTQITSGYTKHCNDEQWATYLNAVSILEQYGDNLEILHGTGAPLTVDTIEQRTAAHIRRTGEKPVLILDYLQILPVPESVNIYSDKRGIDYNISRLRSIATLHDIPVIIVSSFARTSYDSEASMQSYKESGSIEYSADTLIALQLHGVGTPGFNAKRAKAMIPRKIDLTVLKQRYGAIGQTISYDLYALYSTFVEQALPELPKSIPVPFESSGAALMAKLSQSAHYK